MNLAFPLNIVKPYINSIHIANIVIIKKNKQPPRGFLHGAAFLFRRLLVSSAQQGQRMSAARGKCR